MPGFARKLVGLLGVFAFGFTSACSTDSQTTNVGGTKTATATTTTSKKATSTDETAANPRASCQERVFGGDRPVRLELPLVYDCRKGGPLLVVLHGYSGTGPGTIDYFGIKAESEKRGFLYLGPDGTKDSSGKQFWNATSACCNFSNTAIDDSAYISKLIDDVGAEWNVDRTRVFLLGHSNGGFMAYRMACEHRTQIAGIASLAGAMPDDISNCPSGEEVSVLQIHGTADETISYEGGSLLGNRYPSAKSSVLDWVSSNGCNPTEKVSKTQLDLVEDLAGSDTDQIVFTGCKRSTEVALWTINRGVHTPKLSASFASAVVDFLYAHTKR
jgi:polyhydroxybutyrate depolymerase